MVHAVQTHTDSPKNSLTKCNRRCVRERCHLETSAMSHGVNAIPTFKKDLCSTALRIDENETIMRGSDREGEIVRDSER